MGAAMMLWMLVVWTGILGLALTLAAWLFPTVPVAPRSTARDILDSRYARGELTPERYRQMREELAPELGWPGDTPALNHPGTSGTYPDGRS